MANPTDDLSAGDSTPKVAKASIKEITLAVNRISYTIKTPDDLVTPDALQVSSDGNFAVGDAPLAYLTYGRTIYIHNTANAGNVSDQVQLVMSSTNNNALVIVQPGGSANYGAFQIRRPDNNVAVGLRYRLDQAAFKIDMYNAATTTTNVVARFNPTGEFVVGDTTATTGKVMVLGGIWAGGSENMLSLTPSVATRPALISGTPNGSLQISGGNNTATGGRGGQIDFNSAGWGSGAGTLGFRTGTGTDGAAQPEVGRWLANGWLGVGTTDAQAMLHVRAPLGTRTRIISESIADVGGFTSRRINGTLAAPSAIKANDLIGYFNAHGASDGAGGFLVGATIQMIATQDWNSTSAGSGILLSTVMNNTTPTVKALWLDHNGNAGFNTSMPQSKMAIAYGDGLNGYEISPSATDVSLLSINRSTPVYTPTKYLSESHAWFTGASTNVQSMTLGNNGTLAVNTTVLSGGSGNTLVNSKVIVAGQGSETLLTLAANTVYAGLKFKSGPLHATSGGANYYDITTRGGDASNGVATQSDTTLIRLESANSLVPRVLLQPNGNTAQVVVGPGVTSGNTKFVVEAEAGWESPHILTVGKVVTGATNPNADIVLRRAGTVSAAAGKMPWIQMESTDASFAGNNSGAIGSAANNVQIWNYVSNAWSLRLDVGGTSGTTTSNNSVLINGQSGTALTVRAPAATAASVVLQANQSFGVAYWMTTKTDGSFHIGANGGSEPAMGVAAFASSGKAVGMFAGSVGQLDYTYAHGGTARALMIHNPDTTLNAQGHLMISSGNTSIANSAIGGVTWALPATQGNTGQSRVVNIGAVTDLAHTSAVPQGRFEIATKGPTGTTATTRIFVRASGNVSFGNTLNDTARLYIYNEGRNVDGVRVDFSDTSNSASTFVSHRSDTNGYAMSFIVGGQIAGAITHPSATTTSYGTGSDRRIKKNIKPAASAGETIDAIQVVEHDFIADDYHVPYSFIAQDLNEVYPPAVVKGDDELDVSETSRIWQVDNSKLVPMLVKEIQELRADRTSMRADLNHLQELVDMLIADKSK